MNMKRVKTETLTDRALDWAVATCVGYSNLRADPHRFAEPGNLIMDPPRVAYGPVDLTDLDFSTDAASSLPLIQAARIGLLPNRDGAGWEAGTAWEFFESESSVYHRSSGPTMLVAGLRCLVSSELGEVIDIPECLA